MPKVLSKREKTIFYLTIGVFIFALLFNVMILPFLNKNEILNKEILYNREKLKKYLWLLSKKEEIQKKYRKFVPLASVSGQHEDAAMAALAEIEGLAEKSRIKIIDLRPDQRVGEGQLYKEILIEVRTEGSLQDYIKFLYHVENSLSLLKIKKFQLTSKLNSPTLEGSFSIVQLSAN